MAAHFWVFPWFALLAGLASWLVALLRAGPAARRFRALAPPSFLLIFTLAAVLAVLAALRLGSAAGVDVIAARGVLLGALGGGLLVLLCRQMGAFPGQAPAGPDSRRARAALAPAVFGAATALVAGARLWLTHGEMSGLTALSLGCALAVLCLGVAPALLLSVTEAGRPQPLETSQAPLSVLALLYVVGLAGAVQLGFTRTQAIADMFWADLPLLLGGALCLGLLLGAGLARGFRSRPWVASAPVLLLGLAAAALLSRVVVHEWTLLKLVVLGIVAFGLFGLLCRRITEDTRPQPDGDPSGLAAPELAALLGFLPLVLAFSQAFSYWAGYGMAVLTLSGWFILAPLLLPQPLPAEAVSDPAPDVVPARMGLALSFGTLLLLHRLLLLAGGRVVHSEGPGDSWDLFAICLGALLPLAVTAWIRLARREARAPGWLGLLEWLAVLIVPAVLIGDLLGVRALAGLFLGAALGQLIPAGEGDGRRFAPLALSGLILTLGLLLVLPLLQGWTPPTRRLEGLLVLGVAGLIVLRLLLPARLRLGRART